LNLAGIAAIVRDHVIEGQSLILLVEDDPRDVEMTLDALSAHHLSNEIVVVSDGAAALDFLYRRGVYLGRESDDPVLILLDNKMPKVTGLEVLKIIKADRKLQSIPVVALTSSREPIDLEHFYAHGANAYVVKPVDFGDFVSAVKQVGMFWVALNEPPPKV